MPFWNIPFRHFCVKIYLCTPYRGYFVKFCIFYKNLSKFFKIVPIIYNRKTTGG